MTFGATRGDRTHIIGFSNRRMNHHCQSSIVGVGFRLLPFKLCLQSLIKLSLLELLLLLFR